MVEGSRWREGGDSSILLGSIRSPAAALSCIRMTSSLFARKLATPERRDFLPLARRKPLYVSRRPATPKSFGSGANSQGKARCAGVRREWSEASVLRHVRAAGRVEFICAAFCGQHPLTKVNQMSRAINFSLTEAELRQRCKLHEVGISAIEGLPKGGTRLVCLTSRGAEIMRRRYPKEIIDRPQTRHPHFVSALQK